MKIGRNLADDPTEQNDLSKQFPERAAELKALWENWAQENNVSRPKSAAGQKI